MKLGFIIGALFATWLTLNYPDQMRSYFTKAVDYIEVSKHLLTHPSEHALRIQKVTFRVHCSSYAFALNTLDGYGSRCWSPWAMCQSAGVWSRA